MLRYAAVVVLLCATVLTATAQQPYNPLAVDLTRMLVKDLFESNAVPYVQPMVTTINATSNAGFFSEAYVPDSVDRPYFRVSVRGMVGFVRADQRTFVPGLNLGEPSANLLNDVSKYGTIDFLNGRFLIGSRYEDTLGLASLLLREMLIEARRQGRMPLPPVAATLFGNKPDVRFYLPPTDTLLGALRNRADYQAIIALGGSAVDSTLAGLLDSLSLPERLTLPPGVDLSSLIAAVPQFEIGSLFGTELLVRFVPPIELDSNVGKFSFYGVGLKHSLSQYFPERWFDLAIQGVYQGTSLTNEVGFTESSLEAEARIWSANVHASKELFGFLAVYTGLAYERIDVTSTYRYVLPQEIQIALGLLPPQEPNKPSEPTAEQPGDKLVQTSVIQANDTNIKWVVGAAAQLGPFRLFADYNVSRFNVFSGGVEVRF